MAVTNYTDSNNNNWDSRTLERKEDVREWLPHFKAFHIFTQCVQTLLCLQLWAKTRLLPGMGQTSQVWVTHFHWGTIKQKNFSLCIHSTRDRHYQVRGC